MLVHNHGHPHILLLQVGQSFFKLYDHTTHTQRTRWKSAHHSFGSVLHLTRGSVCLMCRAAPCHPPAAASCLLLSPGGRLRPGEDDVTGLKRKLTRRLAAQQEDLRPVWEVRRRRRWNTAAALRPMLLLPAFVLT